MNVPEAVGLWPSIVDIARSAGCDWWLSCGTCLGAYRDQGFIPWDKDIDLGCWQDDLPALRDRFHAAGWTITRNRPQHVFAVHDNVRVDLHGHAGLDGTVSFELLRGKLKFVFNDRFFDRFDTVSLYGIDVPVPSPVEEYLAAAYGPTWQVPDRSWNFRRAPSARRP